MDINEPRRDKPTTDVNGLPPLECAGRGNLGDPAALNGDVAPEAGIPTSV
jgi:hypothetical protein